MDYLSAFKREIFTPLATLVIPGMIAAGPWMVLLRIWVPALDAFGERYELAAWVMVIGAVIALGLTLENLGSQVEVHVLDPLLYKQNPKHYEEWYAYLKLSLPDAVVGQEYLQAILLHLKFELAMVPGLLICLVGLVRLNWETNFWPHNRTFLYAGLVGGACYFSREAYASARVLARTRRVLLGLDPAKDPYRPQRKATAKVYLQWLAAIVAVVFLLWGIERLFY